MIYSTPATVDDPWRSMDGYKIDTLLTEAECICAPDEYDMRQRKLLHEIARYIVKKELEIYDS